MCIHSSVILRQLFKEIDLIFNIREDFNSGLHHLRNLFQIIVFCDDFFQIRLCHLIELVFLHGFHVFPVHPFEFYRIEYSR